MTLRTLWRYVYGHRQAVLENRNAMLNGLSLMWSDKAEPMDRDRFLWTGVVAPETAATSPYKMGDRPIDHTVNVLAAQIHREGKFDLESLMKTYHTWMGSDVEES